jgi:hypothetical protein
MEFPLTRERLKNYKKKEAMANHKKEMVNREIQRICIEVERTVMTTDDTMYKYSISDIVRDGISTSDDILSMYGPQTGILPEILEIINKLFPDSTITVDSLKTNILIDWS